MSIQRKWDECGVVEVDFAPVVTATNTKEKWRKWASERNMLVKVKAASTNARNNGLIEIVPCDTATDLPIGTLRAITGDPSDFPSKFVARIGVEAYDINVDGAGTGELADADFGRKIQPDAEGKATIVTSGGVGRVVGGDKQNLRMAYDFRDNFR